MAGNRPKVWYTLLTAAGSYIFFALQFFVDSDATFSLFSGFLSYFGIDISKVPNRHLAVAIILFIPFVLCVWGARCLLFDAYARLTISQRLGAFSKSIDEIARYHRKNLVDGTILSLKKSRSSDKRELISAISNTMIDFLITDVRDAFQELCLSYDIRVAVYALGYPAGGSRSSTQLYMRNTTEFDLDLDNEIVFRQKTGTKEFEGFCGKAWNTEKPQGGTYEIFPFVFDPVFLPGSAFDKERSFLCIPVMAMTAKGAKPIAVLCIDSGRKIDFVMSDDLKSKINKAVSQTFSALSKYIKWPEN